MFKYFLTINTHPLQIIAYYYFRWLAALEYSIDRWIKIG